jgi:hypothetical protein
VFHSSARVAQPADARAVGLTDRFCWVGLRKRVAQGGRSKRGAGRKAETPPPASFLELGLFQRPRVRSDVVQEGEERLPVLVFPGRATAHRATLGSGTAACARSARRASKSKQRAWSSFAPRRVGVVNRHRKRGTFDSIRRSARSQRIQTSRRCRRNSRLRNGRRHLVHSASNELLDVSPVDCRLTLHLVAPVVGFRIPLRLRPDVGLAYGT